MSYYDTGELNRWLDAASEVERALWDPTQPEPELMLPWVNEREKGYGRAPERNGGQGQRRGAPELITPPRVMRDDRPDYRDVLAVWPDADDPRRRAVMNVHVRDVAAYDVGNNLVDLDRELRRAVHFLEVGLTTPRRGRAAEVVVASQTRSLDVVLVLAEQAYNAALSGPFQFGLVLHWFWERRPKGGGWPKPFPATNTADVAMELARTARAAVAQGDAVHLNMKIGPEGFTEMDFRSGPPELLQGGPVP